MINIEQNQRIAENPSLIVASAAGSYEDNDLIQFYDEGNPGVVVGAFAAQFVKYGSLVYKFNEAEDLGREILKIEPESTHSAASFVRMKDKLKKQLDQGNLEPQSLNQAMQDEQNKIEQQVENVGQVESANTQDTVSENQNSQTATEESVIVTPNENNTSSTTEPAIDTNTASTTPSIIDSVFGNDASSTLNIIPEATSTEATSTQVLRKIKTKRKIT